MDLSFYPWQETYASQWLEQGDRMAHAWLFHGLPGIGKRQFARALAARLLCETPQDLVACGECQSCQWIKLGHHPDLMLVRPQALALEENEVWGIEAGEASTSSSSSRKPSSNLLVDQVRALEPWYHRSTHAGGWRIVILYPAQSMMQESANALLKSLEEPPARTLFFLVTDSADRLLPTILSRCQRRALKAPPQAQALQWLSEQGVADPVPWLAVAAGAPLLAQKLSQTLKQPCPPWLSRIIADVARNASLDEAAVASELAGLPALEWLEGLQRMAIDLCLCRVGQPPRYLPGQTSELERIAQRHALDDWVQWQSWIAQQRPLAQHPFNARLFARAAVQKLIETVS